MSEEKIVHRCDSCGGTMIFDARSQTLKCPNCGNYQEIADERTTREHALHEYEATKVSAQEKHSSTMECSGCGAQIELDERSSAVSCPYCGSSIVLAQRQLSAIVPDGLRPFQIDKNRAAEIFREWIRKRGLAPNELKRLYQQDKMMGIYLPYWTFDAQMNSPYSAMGGEDYQVEYTDSDGNTKYRTETEWYPVSGNVEAFFDDILIRASETLRPDLLRAIGNFNTRALVSYSPAYISGFAAEVHTIEFGQAHSEARSEMDGRTEAMIRSEVLARYDRVRDIRMSPRYTRETYKHILLPLYSTAYAYKGKTFQVLINGETGVIHGDYPKSIVKIALIILAVLIILALIYFFTQQVDAAAFVFDDVQEIACFEEYNIIL